MTGDRPIRTDLVPVDTTGLGSDPGADSVRRLISKSIAQSTLDVYGRAIRSFHKWCIAEGLSALPASPETVARYLAYEVEPDHERGRPKSPKSLSVVLAAIRAGHLAKGMVSPTDHPHVRLTLAGASREHAENHVDGRKQPLNVHRELDAVIEAIDLDLEDAESRKSAWMTASIPGSGRERLHHEQAGRIIEARRLAALRDRAIILIGFAGALRRSELVAVRMGHIRRVDEGMILRVPKSKTDQEGKGRLIGIPFGERICTIAALVRWLTEARIHNGLVFRRIRKSGTVVDDEKPMTGASVAILVKKRVKAAGIDPEKFSGHSLRSGLLTSAGRNGASLMKMMDQAGQKSVDVTRGYVRDLEIFEGNVLKGLL